MSSSHSEAPDTYQPLPDVPMQAVNTYARLWQLETWLRTMVYVELRALLGDEWEKHLRKNENSFLTDKNLTHMPTPDANPLSYSQLWQLISLVNDYWDCFSIYFPPKDILNAKLKEITQIRHRIAHFRVGHSDDLERVKQFMRDLDEGFWRFCTSYNNAQPVLPQSKDMISARFLSLDPLPWNEFEEGKWAKFGQRDNSLPVGLNVRTQRRPWAKNVLAPGGDGHLYDVFMFAQEERGFDIRLLMERTRPLHRHLVHLCLDNNNASIRITIPSLLSAEQIVNIIEEFHSQAINSIQRRWHDRDKMTALAHAWPEYVIGPENPLTFLDSNMRCSFFNA